MMVDVSLETNVRLNHLGATTEFIHPANRERYVFMIRVGSASPSSA